ncbi:flagellar hook-basal body protein [Pontibacillus litoralis]|uniref:Flagellar hook-basal body protein n=1 Tax=Pontibacillus litoralis JSM 072002 TaxID=1385512 RepID=A0A0A5G300_9BACI|nr:flagellar hook-basal body protein [Pontibacillus litoralis]KGX86429.1 flagellar hook-basal body protein [Pontibacillus litoralis JSM 072002]
MLHSSMNAAVTMGQLQKKLDVIGNNMANSNTPGYKNRQAEFSSLLYQQINHVENEGANPNRLTPEGLRVGSGAYVTSTDVDMSQGSIQETGRPLDVALLKDNHMFQVDVTQNGQTERMYTRDGSFSLSANEDGTVSLVTSNGHPVIGENGPIRIEAGYKSVSVREDGVILVERNGVQMAEDRLLIVDATRPRFLESAGKNLYAIPDTNINADDIMEDVPLMNTSLKQGALETSNVDMANQMTEMMMTQRAYQFNSRSISMGDQMMGLVNQLR